MRQEAAEWAIRLGAGELSAADRIALSNWLAADDQRHEMLTRACLTWQALAEIEPQPVVPARRQMRLGPAREGRRRIRLWRWAAAAMVLLMLGVGGWRGPDWRVQMQADYLTAVGELNRWELPDGSVVELDAHSALALQFDQQQRRVQLLRGTAYFDVAPQTAQEPRPFIVDAGGAQNQALGTAFVVGLESPGAWMGVLEHSVGVSLKTNPLAHERALVVSEGQSVRYDVEHGIRWVEELDVQRATAWRRGMLVFERQPLSEVVAVLERYRGGRIWISDSELSQREVSAVVRLDSLDQAVAGLITELGARRLDLPGVIWLF